MVVHGACGFRCTRVLASMASEKCRRVLLWRYAPGAQEHRSTTRAKWRRQADLEDGHEDKEERREDPKVLGLAQHKPAERPSVSLCFCAKQARSTGMADTR